MIPIKAFKEELSKPKGARKTSKKLSFLNECDVIPNPEQRIFLHWGSGNFAAVFKLEKEGKPLALRCMTGQPQVDLGKRATALEEHLASLPKPLPYFVDYSFYKRGLQAEQDMRDVFVMDWVEGQELDKAVEFLIQNEPALLEVLARNWHQLMFDLDEAGIAHGDLQHGNVKVLEDLSLVLVDYDTVFVPSLAGHPPAAVGAPGYVHPKILSGEIQKEFGPAMDSFSGIVIYLSLLAIHSDPSLFRKYSADNLLFSEQDLESPHSSALFAVLQYSPVTTVAKLANGLIAMLDNPNLLQKKYTAFLKPPQQLPAFPQPPIPPGFWLPGPTSLWIHGTTVPLVPAPGTSAAQSVPSSMNSSPTQPSGAPTQAAPVTAPPVSNATGPMTAPAELSSPPARPGRRYNLLIGAICVAIICLTLAPKSPLGGIQGTASVMKVAWSVLSRTPPEATAIILLGLLPLFVFNAFPLAAELHRLHSDRKVLADVRSALAATPVLDAATISGALAGASPSSPLWIGVEAVWNARFLEHPDLEAIGSIMDRAESIKAGIAKGAPNRILMLSLLGTVLGLAGVVRSLEPNIAKALAESNTDDLLRSLSGTINTMGTAFASTAWGIILASIMAGLLQSVAQQRSASVAESRRFVLGELAPRLMPKSVTAVTDQISSVLWHTQVLVENVERTATKVAHDLNAAVVEIVQATIDATVTLQASATIMNDFVSKDFKPTVEDLSLQVKFSKDTTKKLDESIETMTTSIQESAKELIATHEKHINRIENLNTSQAKLAQNVKDQIDASAATASAAYERAGQALIKEINEVVAQVEKLVSRTSPKLPSEAEWKAIQDTLRQAVAVLTSERAKVQSGGPVTTGPDPNGPAIQQALRDLQVQIQRLSEATNRNADVLSVIARQPQPQSQQPDQQPYGYNGNYPRPNTGGVAVVQDGHAVNPVQQRTYVPTNPAPQPPTRPTTPPVPEKKKKWWQVK